MSLILLRTEHVLLETGGGIGQAIGAGVGPVAENLLISGEDTHRELLIESALGAGAGDVTGTYLGERSTQ